MRWWTFFHILPVARAAILPPQNVSGADSSISFNRVPSNFKLDIRRERNSVQIIPFYTNALKVMLVESLYPFFDPTDGFDNSLLDKPPKFFASASPSVFPHLQHCHIIWAVQYYVEMTHQSRDYQEVTARMMIKTSKWGDVGEFAIRQSLSANDVDQQRNATDNDVSKSALSGTVSNVTQSLGLLRPGTVNSDTMLVQAFFVDKGKTLPSLDMFITAVRAVAILAEAETDETVSEWHYADEETKMRISMTSATGVSTKTTFGDIIEGIEFLIDCMLSFKRFAEMVGKFYQENSKRVDYGEMLITKYEPANEVASA